MASKNKKQIKKYLIPGIIGAVLIIVLAIFFIIPTKEETDDRTITPPSSSEVVHPAVCGDGTCAFAEDCNKCKQDCPCSKDQYCSSAGICLTPTCGDSICSDEEKNSNCCRDCGCEEGQICDWKTELCQAKAIITDEQLYGVAEKFIKDREIKGKIMSVREDEDVINGESVRQIGIDCTAKGDPVLCWIILSINDEGEVVDESWVI